MIRRSTAVAIVAIVLSLIVHFLGLDFATSNQPARSSKDAPRDAIVMDNAFEDFADAVAKPVKPDPAPVPDPPLETPPEPERVEMPTSEALVAADNPQRVFAPDSGIATTDQPHTGEPSKPEQGGVAEPKTVEQDSDPKESDVDLPVTLPVAPEKMGQAPEGEANANTEPVEATAEATMPEPLANVGASELAVLAVPVISLEIAPVSPEMAEIAAQPLHEDPEPPEVEDDTGGSDLAVLSSLRPRLPSRRPPQEPTGALDGSTDFEDLQLPDAPLIESPLAAYQRDGIDPFVYKNSGDGSDGAGSSDSRGPGNSDITNYVGRVLMHLNRTDAVYVSGRGFARVLFQINPDGTLAWVDVIDSSGSQEIERAAKAQVQSGAPFPRHRKALSQK